MKIGLLSDTHGFLDQQVFLHFAACDQVWHAGDIGDRVVADELERFKPFKAVFGNIDNPELRLRYPEDLWLQIEGLTVLMTHIGGVPSTYNARVKKLFKQQVPDIFICGHSHILRIKRDPAYKDMLYLNPGAAGNHGFHQIKTLVRFDVTAGAISNLEVIELGKRGAIST